MSKLIYVDPVLMEGVEKSQSIEKNRVALALTFS